MMMLMCDTWIVKKQKRLSFNGEASWIVARCGVVEASHMKGEIDWNIYV
jgi:hypothetical protein